MKETGIGTERCRDKEVRQWSGELGEITVVSSENLNESEKQETLKSVKSIWHLLLRRKLKMKLLEGERTERKWENKNLMLLVSNQSYYHYLKPRQNHTFYHINSTDVS